ncbi:glycosyltransferase [candidate division KSB1 bacterium]|nr:glycosyltransferase [candidate division KSB1 bacterium]
MKKPKIAVIVRSLGLEYDDRVRKECITLAKVADVTLFVSFENNYEEEGETSYGIPYKSFHLKTREKLKSGKFLFIKALEFYFRVRNHIKDFDLIWAHEEYSFLFPLVSKENTCIWDLHEIPLWFEKPLISWLFNIIEKRSKIIIHANQHRINYLMKNKIVKYKHKHAFIRNYPDKTFLESKSIPENYNYFINWLNNEHYVYLQGLFIPGRYPYNIISALLETTSLKIVIVGKIDSNELRLLKNKYGQLMAPRVFFAGMINQLDIPQYLKNAMFSIVLYDYSIPNNRYCEANRFYQAINFGIPVIVGSNESMADFIKAYKFGIALEKDGRDIEEISHAITRMLDNYNYYSNNAEYCKNKLLWSDDTIKQEWLT